MTTPEQHRPGALRHRAAPTLITFLVIAGGVYATAYVAISVLRHVVMPILAVVAGVWAARWVFRVTGRDE
ncbi:MAG TPA: hypothetical protein VFP54_01875 [Acidimicrobiales bacterium]|nr:hypothetical protein [Acidimicrobiales bacterium]